MSETILSPNTNQPIVISAVSNLPAQVSQNQEILGVETLTQADLYVPRIKLLQAMSDEVSNREGIAGVWFSTLSGQSYGTSFEFVPIRVSKSRVYFDPNNRTEPICRSADGKFNLNGEDCFSACPFPEAKQWVERKPPACTESLDYLILPLEDDFPAVVSLMKSSYDAGRRLNTMLIAARCPAWSFVYELQAIKRQNEKGAFFIADVRKLIKDNAPVSSDEGIRALASQFYKLALSSKLEIEDTVPF
jgi:hypothetical protein